MPQDLRKYTTQTKIRLLVGFFLLLFSLGLGLIAILYGCRSALLGLFCLLGSGLPIGLIALLMLGLDRIVRKNNPQ